MQPIKANQWSAIESWLYNACRLKIAHCFWRLLISHSGLLMHLLQFHGHDGLGDAPQAVPTAASVTISASQGLL